ncbi:hypothetical protein DR64_4675 [Paraburkholderia xenovorans LB400]|uniref:Uncharacterized protein n=1 Tax=Paraburkholderia xenovorans (strain LB400) TaxID=266265 RepID=Q13QJ3_PARXL|nr:hypothetical protein [Paraburkholderia xenovorans]ABE33646.1 hypothetical protein Bxe_B2343 [Paraburkholderia xenovorans LB400]AIP36810.1 hypothetical protein DR64_4675 [Paraburkholderia xenovorans LB400]NPT34144.1 hypothetical protein [Paraburkholderia xenovorans]
MSNTEEVLWLLDRAATLDAAVRDLALALETPTEDPRFALKGIVYKALSDQHGFTVTLHGLTLLPVYEQVLDRSRDCPDLFAWIHLCLPGDGGKPAKSIVSLLVADTGDYSDDGTTRFDYSTYDVTGRPSDLARYRLSLAIARALQACLPTLPAAQAACDPAPADHQAA